MFGTLIRRLNQRDYELAALKFLRQGATESAVRLAIGIELRRDCGPGRGKHAIGAKAKYGKLTREVGRRERKAIERRIGRVCKRWFKHHARPPEGDEG